MRFIRTVIALAYFFSSSAGWTSTQPPLVTPAFIADRAANLLNEAHNWEGLLLMLEKAGNRVQAHTIRDYLKNKVNLKAAFPRFSGEQNKLVWVDNGAKDFLRVDSDYHFNYRGNVFNPPSEKEIDLFIQDSWPRLAQPITSFFSFVIPDAFANSMETKTGIALGAVLITGLVVAGLATAGGAWALAGAVMYSGSVMGFLALFGNKVYQLSKDGGVSCDDGRFVLHFQPDSQLTSTTGTIPTNAAVYPKDEDGKPLKCTPQLAKQLEDHINGAASGYLENVKRSPYGTNQLPGATR